MILSVRVIGFILTGRPVIPADVLTVALSESDPKRVVILEALIIPVVKASRVIRTDALIEVSVKVTASFPKPVIAPLEPLAKTLLISVAVPSIVLTEEALTIPEY